MSRTVIKANKSHAVLVFSAAYRIYCIWNSVVSITHLFSLYDASLQTWLVRSSSFIDIIPVENQGL